MVGVYIILCSIVLPSVQSSTHWVVTEDGRLQSLPDSFFQLRRPYDLVALLHQEDRTALLENLKKELIYQKTDIDRNEDKETNVEKRLYSTDEDCIAAGKPLTEIDLHVSTSLSFESRGIKLKAFEDESQTGRKLRKPNCTAVVDLEFSMQSFEHLVGMQLRSNLTIPPEVNLISQIELLEADTVEEYGHQIYSGLVKNKTSWILFNMAVYYWRIVGNAYNAMECVRRALHFSPSEYKDIALVNLANILHRAQHTEEAAIVASSAVKSNPSNPVGLFTLGNIYTVITEYDKAVDCYKDVLKYEPENAVAERNFKAVLCHRKLEQALEAQHNSLQKTLSELRSYQQQHETWIKQHEKLMLEQATPESRRDSRIYFEEQKFRRSQGKPNEDCYTYQQDGHSFSSCNAKRENKLNNDPKIDLSLNLQMLHSVESKVEKLEEAVSKNDSPTEDGVSNFSEPTNPPRYPSDPLSRTGTNSILEALGSDWPLPEDCIPKTKGLPSTTEYPSIFLPPDNKGFEVNKILGELQGLKPLEEHPLPWFPPVCEQKEGADESGTSFMPAGKVKEQFPKLPDASLRDVLLSYVDGDQSTEEEVGQRILTALKQSIGPQWLLYNMAALYWRINGNVHNAIECLRQSLRAVRSEFADVPFVNYASLLHKMGLPDEALVLALKAYSFNSHEPDTNFLLGNLWTLKKNFTGAVFHYKQVIMQNPAFEDAMQFLQRVSCYSKFHATPEETSAGSQPITTTCPTIDVDTVVCTQNHCPNDGDENCLTTVRCFTHTQWTDEELARNCHFHNRKILLAKKIDEVTEEYLQTEDDVLTLLPPKDVQLSNADPAELEPQLKDLQQNQEQKPQEPTKKMHLKVDVGSLSKGAISESDFEPLRAPRPVIDDPLPEIIHPPKERHHFLAPTLSECRTLHFVNLKHFTSTWLSVSAKNVHINDYVNMRAPLPELLEVPKCDASFPSSAMTLDHLAGVKYRSKLAYTAEVGLKEAFQTLGIEGEKPQPVDNVATYLADALKKNSTSWVLTTLAALYWRISGNANEAINCLREALHYAPTNMKDIPLISLANVFHRADLLNDALIVANMALETSPKFVVIHFTLANIFAAKGDLDNAVAFYESTLALQSSFEPAKDRLRSIYCGALLLNRGIQPLTRTPVPSSSSAAASSTASSSGDALGSSP